METENQVQCPVVEEQKAKQLSQKDAVFNAFSEVIDEKGNVRAEGEPLKVLFTKDVRKAVRQKLYAGIKAGTIKCKPTYDEKKLKKYCSGLISNWLAKDERYSK